MIPPPSVALASSTATAFDGGLPARLFDQNLPHGLRGGREEMPATIPAGIFFADESHVGLVDEGRGLERVAFGLAAHVGVGEAPELAIEDREQLLGSLWVSVRCGFEYGCQVGARAFHSVIPLIG